MSTRMKQPAWCRGLSERDWLLDGSPIRKPLLWRWKLLDWSKAYLDMGPSPAGNLGPYWKVPCPREETVHRLYPKVMQGKWALAIRQAILEEAARAIARAQPERKKLRVVRSA